MEVLGHLLWWHIVSDVVVPYTLAQQMSEDLGTPTPMPPAAIDVYRRLVGTCTRTYLLDERRRVKQTLVHHRAEEKLLISKMARSVFDLDGNLVDSTSIGELIFTKKGRGEKSQARLAVNLHVASVDVEARRFASQIRAEYARGCASLDAQALRRSTRVFLAQVHALLLGDPYFIPHQENAEQLTAWFEKIGAGCECHFAPIGDTPRTRTMLSEALLAAIDSDPASIDLVEAYIPLGVVPESIWDRLEGS